ncbi:nose resistant to fluoxetine protein 6-like [Leptidea sinapis]|uniref:nose resistant to fluoxetine protein 6-like n=1 Tax=Leptidea sinapis TaxID=189913 RepID=UPI0021C4BB4D|nr:nose resistant to fluoxetine protein 6-like [Leptidea sinapis]
MSMIVIAHQVLMFNGGPVSDGYMFDKKVTSLFGLLLIHADLLVDTFFLVSGLLTAFTVTKINVRLNIILSLFLKRYLRLVVAYALVIYYVSAVYPYTGSGPLWHRAVAQDTVQCRKNWWLSLLMLGNYVDTDNMCLIVTWYIPCDYHFFVITVLMYCLYTRFTKASRLLIGAVMAAAVVTPGIINYINNLPPIQMFTYDFMTNFRGPRQFHITYIKSHTRYAAYLIGFFTGCIIEKYSKDTVKRISQKWAIIGSCVGFTTMMVTQLTGSMVLWREFTAIESALYAAFNRPIWACGAALFTLSCVFGNVPLVNSFLRWYPWVPLSRLSYGVYLVHSVIILRDVSVTRTAPHNDIFMEIAESMGVIVISCFIAFLIILLAESPVNNLSTLALVTKSRTKSSQPGLKATLDEQAMTNNGNVQEIGYFKGTIPSSVHVDSKL